MGKVTPTTVKALARNKAFETLVKIMKESYGSENVYITGDSEIAVKIDTAPTGEPIFATYSPTIKDYCDRTTKTKTIKAFNPNIEVSEFAEKCSEREKKAEIAKENKAKKIEIDKKRREKAMEERQKLEEKKKKGGE